LGEFDYEWHFKLGEFDYEWHFKLGEFDYEWHFKLEEFDCEWRFKLGEFDSISELQISCVFAFFTLWKRVKTHVLSDQSVHLCIHIAV
jgi:hypothetical protein